MTGKQTGESSSGTKGVARRLSSCVVASILTTVRRPNVIPTNLDRRNPGWNPGWSLNRGLEP